MQALAVDEFAKGVVARGRQAVPAAVKRIDEFEEHPGPEVRRPPSPDRLRYRPESAQVIYYGRQRSRCGDREASLARIFPALDFLAAL